LRDGGRSGKNESKMWLGGHTPQFASGWAERLTVGGGGGGKISNSKEGLRNARTLGRKRLFQRKKKEGKKVYEGRGTRKSSPKGGPLT